MNGTTKDEMTPRERMEAFGSGHPIDRIPCTCHLSEYGARLTGVSIAAYHHSSDLMVGGALEVFRELRLDSVSVGPDLLALPEALGTRLAFSDRERPQLAEPAVRSYEDIDRIGELNPERDGRLYLYLDALERIDRSIGREVRVSTGIGGPFTTAALLRGTDAFLRDLLISPEFAHVLLERATQAILRYMEAARDRGISCSIGEPLASGDVISPRHFREFAKPYLSRICGWARGTSRKGPTLHVCGDTRSIWSDMADSGASFLSLDNTIDLEAAKKAVGDRAGLTGNVPPVEVLMNGTTTEVTEAAKACIRKAFDTPKGFILSSGCTVPLDTPPANIRAMVEAARRFGRLPIDPGLLA
ncbi:MAG TPA: uroporphyrinogen decarboxylase family protein [Syntrophorhabdales bacterium]|nr:uroporphyrinogen decarboxylase family protein [Syntrophorhabdales bacterium]